MIYLALYLAASIAATILFCGMCKINEGGL
jgi:hypothetical protein